MVRFTSRIGNDHQENDDNHQMTDPVDLTEIEGCCGEQKNERKSGETTDQRRPEQCESQAKFHDSSRGNDGGDIEAQSQF